MRSSASPDLDRTRGIAKPVSDVGSLVASGIQPRCSFRALALASVVTLTGVAHAQLIDAPIRAGVGTLLDQGLIQRNEQVNPLQPTGQPIPPPQRQGDLPRPGPYGPEGGVFQLINHGGGFRRQGEIVHMDGGIEFTDRGYHVWADEVTGNTRTSTYILKGNVRVLGEEQSIYGDLVQVNFDDRTFVSEDAQSTLKPGLVQGRVRDNVYVKAHRSYGSQQEIWGEKTSATTCSYPDPHWEIVAERTNVRPGRRVIFRKVKIKILGRTVLNLPYLSVPLDERFYNNLPVVGQGRQEGYFIKNRFSFELNPAAAMSTRLDYFTRLGVGLGAGVRYDTPRSSGNLSLYTIQGPHRQFDVIGQHRQNLGWATLNLDGSYQDSNYLISTNSTILNTRAVLLIPRGLSTDRITYFQTSSRSPGISTMQRTVSLNDSSRWNRKFSTTLDVNYSTNSSSFTSGTPVRREQVDVTFRALSDLEKAQARLDYIRSIPIGETTGFFTASDVTPAFTLLTDSRRMFGPGAEVRFPFQAQLSYGEYSDPIRNGRLTRGNFELGFQNPRVNPGRRFNFTYQGEFKQGIYSDDTAQYVLRGSTQFSYNFQRNSVINLRYNYLRPYGFSPLQIDRRGNIHNLLGDVSYMPVRNLQLGVTTGYDFNLIKQGAETPWQQVGINARYTLSNYFQARAISIYDPTRHAFSSTRLDVTWIPGSTYVSFGAKYDGIRSKWAAANLFIDGIRIGRLSTSLLLNYNGYTRKFDAEQYSFIYDMHCAEAVLQYINTPTGFNSGRRVYFFIRLKALPFDTPFGTGQRGQPIGTGTGRDF